jgi:hypothetical protein
MDPTQNLKQADPLAVLMDVLDAPNVVPSARTDQAMPNPAHDSNPRPSDSQAHAASDGPAASSVPPVDTTFRPVADNVRRPGNRASFGRRAVRGLIGFLLAVCIGVASFVWQSPYGDEARERVASWMPESFPTLPQFVLTLFQPRESPGLAAQPTPSADQAVAAATAPAQPAASQPAAPAQTAPEAAAPTAALSPESRQLLQSMARDLAAVEQGIEQLKASQEQLTRDNAKLSEQLKVNQERMTRVLAKASEQNQNLRPKLPARPPLPTARELREPMSTLPPPQAIAPPPGTAQPQAAVQPQADPELPSAPRPPMPVR